MATITTKFDIGQIVYVSNAIWDTTRHECPDCKGAGAWEVTTPAGETFSTVCPTCCGPWDEKRGWVERYSYRPHVERLTIGQIRVHVGHAPEVRVMAHETGVGSGTLWDEGRLFASREEAEECAKKWAAERQAEYDKRQEEEREHKRKKARPRKPKSTAL